MLLLFSLIISVCFSCSSSKPGFEPSITASGHTLPSAVQPVQPTSVRPFLLVSVVLTSQLLIGFGFLTLLNVSRENDPSWAIEIQDDVIEECNKHGGIVHIYVDKNSAQVSWICDVKCRNIWISDRLTNRMFFCCCC